MPISQRSRIRLFYLLFGAMFGFGVFSHSAPFVSLIIKPSTSTLPLVASNRPIDWREFSAQGFQSLKAEGRPVLVFFHADWDMASQLVKANLANAEIEQLLRQHGIETLDADCTHANLPEAEALRKSLGFQPNNVVPVVAIFPTSNSPPTVLWGIKEEEILAALQDIARQ